MRIDSHQHFWKYNPHEFAWISDAMAVLQRDYLPAELEVLLKEAGFDGSIAVQARQCIEETSWLLELAAEHPFIRGVVGWLDLCSEEIEAQLRQFASHPKLVGVRHVVHDEPDDAFMYRADFRNGMNCLRGSGLVYDLLIFPKHLEAACDLVREFPDQSFVVDHIAKPNIAQGMLSPWREGIEALSVLPNVNCKLSGMVTEAHWQSWSPQQLRPYLEIVYSAFGPERLMIGSDWPVCKVAGSYADVMEVVIEFVSNLPSQQQTAILGGNCARIYRTPKPATQSPTATAELGLEVSVCGEV